MINEFEHFSPNNYKKKKFKKNNGDKFKNKSAKQRKFKIQQMQEEELDDDIRDWEENDTTY